MKHVLRAFHVVSCCAAGAVFVLNAMAQDIDTALMGSPARNYTVLDQVDTPAERRDFLTLRGTADPRRRRELAEAFLARYPQSWLLADVYEISSKASVDLDDFPRALADGRMSLRLLPENALLLVPLANVEVQQGLLEAARRDARDALRYLATVAGPSAMTPAAWNELERQLAASSHFVLGRAAITEALRIKSSRRDELLAEAEMELGLARSVEIPEASYLLGLAQLMQAKPAQAASQFMAASRPSSVIRAKALEQLRRLYDTQPRSKRTFESWLAGIPEPAPRAVPQPPMHAAAAAEYAGSAACQPCHSQAYRSWQSTGMGRMLRSYASDRVLADFQAGTEVHDDSGHWTVRVGHDRQPYFEFSAAGQTPRRYPVNYVIGSKWQQAYATRLNDGRIQVFPLQYNALTRRWLNYWKEIDPPGSERADIARFTTLSAATNYQSNCAICHTSQLRAQGSSTQKFELATFREPGIDCEMCHGPSAAHIVAVNSGGRTAQPVDFGKVDHGTGTKICAQCHRQSSLRDQGPKGEMNYVPAELFFSDFKSRPYKEFSRRAFYKDGRFRETTFIAEAFTRSACFRRGEAQCASCHDPHPLNPAANPVSLKFPDDPDRMCLQCHAEIQPRIAAHTHHRPESAGSRCAACHMPKIMNSLSFQAASHQIDDIPRPEMTERFGQKESPLACLLCHADRTTQWAAATLQAW